MVDDVLTAKRYKDERCIAYIAVEKIKDAAATLESDDPNHKNGVKFSISKQRYHDIVETVFNERCARHMNRDLIRVVIDAKLKKL
jgi:hypothetical protein